jgi:hypothetical protein
MLTLSKPPTLKHLLSKPYAIKINKGLWTLFIDNTLIRIDQRGTGFVLSFKIVVNLENM